MPVYQLLLAVAVVRAAVKYGTGDLAWEKTAHVGAHLTPAPTPRHRHPERTASERPARPPPSRETFHEDLDAEPRAPHA